MSVQPFIAVVDDDPGVRVSLDGLIRSLGHRVATFESAELYLACPEAADFACVVSDVQMPGMSGIALTRAISDWKQPVPIILISAFADDGVRNEAMAAGARELIRKPFDGELLIERIEQLLAH